MPEVATRIAAAEFERRAARAELLAGQSPAAHDTLEFAAVLCRAQAQLAGAVETAHRSRPFTGQIADDVIALVPLHERMLFVLADRSPELLAEDARKRREDEPELAQARLIAYWNGDTNARDDYLSRCLLRPYVEVLRAHDLAPERLHRQGFCPFCGGAPSIGALKWAGESEAGLRLLVCGLCGLEWNFNRIRCPACQEDSPEKLPVFRSDTHRSVRIEACETCRQYVKSIDLTIDARPIAEVDDLLSLSMDLWAVDEGYTRIEPGLAGL